MISIAMKNINILKTCCFSTSMKFFEFWKKFVKSKNFVFFCNKTNWEFFLIWEESQFFFLKQKEIWEKLKKKLVDLSSCLKSEFKYHTLNFCKAVHSCLLLIFFQLSFFKCCVQRTLGKEKENHREQSRGTFYFFFCDSKWFFETEIKKFFPTQSFHSFKKVSCDFKKFL